MVSGQMATETQLADVLVIDDYSDIERHLQKAQVCSFEHYFQKMKELVCLE